jgi:hypothetical protein
MVFSETHGVRGMIIFFRGITKTVRSLFREIFRNGIWMATLVVSRSRKNEENKTKKFWHEYMKNMTANNANVQKLVPRSKRGQVFLYICVTVIMLCRNLLVPLVKSFAFLSTLWCTGRKKNAQGSQFWKSAGKTKKLGQKDI